MKRFIISEWSKNKRLHEQEFGAAPGMDPGMGMGQPNFGGGAEMQTPGPQGEAPQEPPQGMPTGEPEQQQPWGNMPDDVASDPQHPDMPEEKEDISFQKWRNLFFKESIRGDHEKLLSMIRDIRDNELDAYPRKFVEDNLQVLFLRRNANINAASTDIRKAMRQELDQNHPAVSTVNHVTNVLDQHPELTEVLIKLKGGLGLKGELHRKFIASLIGGVQVGAGGNSEDIVFNDHEYSIKLSTRYNDRWGRVDLGHWSLREDDPERYLKEPERRRLEEGSPEERDVLLRRIVLQSIAEQFKTRAFYVNVVGEDGTIYTLGWDIGDSLLSAYAEGKLVVRTIESENSEAMINEDGQIIPLVDYKINFSEDTGRLDRYGKQELEEVSFMQRIGGTLYLTASLKTIRQASSSFQGIVLKEIPYRGNPSDLVRLQRCLPDAEQMLMRNC